jgi:hypothetical protein
MLMIYKLNLFSCSLHNLSHDCCHVFVSDSSPNFNKPQVEAAVTESRLSHDSNGEPLQ